MDGSVSYSGSLRNCAMVCSLRRVKHKCKEQFGSYACNDCKYNICEYADIDPQQAKLFVMQTDFEAQDTVSYNRTADIVFWFFILGFLALGLHSFNYYHPGELPKELKQLYQKWLPNIPKTVEAPVSTVFVAVETKLNEHTTQQVYTAIHKTLIEVQESSIRGIDVDHDGEITCHDWSALFYTYYPWKDEVTIELNRPLNHLFNCVLIDGVWRAIEPQTYVTHKPSYWMKDYWGSRYDSSYNEDATETVRFLGWIK